jgi:outer membrane murein-binding lipoprotein Lpp
MKKTFRVNLLIGAAALIALALTGCSSGRNQTNLVAFLQPTNAAVNDIPSNPFVMDVSTATATTLPTTIEGTGLSLNNPFTGAHLSRDGQTVIFTMADGVAGNCVDGQYAPANLNDWVGCSQIYTAPLHGIGTVPPTQITNDTNVDHFEAVFSPDETMIAATVYNYNNVATTIGELVTIPIATKVETFIAPAGMTTGIGYANTPSLTPDNSQILFQGRNSGATAVGIWIVANTAIPNPTPTQLTNAADWNPSLSVDGTEFLFTRSIAGNDNIYKLPIAGEIGTTNIAKPLTTDNHSYQAQFTRDYIVVNSYATSAANVDGNLYLYRINPDGTGQVSLTDSPTVDSFWDWFYD